LIPKFFSVFHLIDAVVDFFFEIRILFFHFVFEVIVFFLGCFFFSGTPIPLPSL
jgi:hypothetical protein